MKVDFKIKHFEIKKDFLISIYKDSITIKKDSNVLNTKIYLTKDIKKIEIIKELNSSTFFLFQFLFSFYGNENTKILLIETINRKDEIYLTNCDMETLYQAIDLINNLIPTKQTQNH